MAGFAPLLYSFARTQSIIRRWKENRGSQLQQALFQFPPKLQQKLIDLHLFAIIPIPQNQNRSFKRGHDSALSVAKFYAENLGIPIIPLLGLKNKKTERITGKSRLHREFSENPFQITPLSPTLHYLYDVIQEKKLKQKEIRVLLVDDLITSGSTLNKATDLIAHYLPHSKIWGAALGIRPGVSKHSVTQFYSAQEFESKKKCGLDSLHTQKYHREIQ
jgi:predicted amidophosphoribosyltransferase